jgi:hypothetical protein
MLLLHASLPRLLAGYKEQSQQEELHIWVPEHHSRWQGDSYTTHSYETILILIALLDNHTDGLYSERRSQKVRCGKLGRCCYWEASVSRNS